jgi:hypothetical protein
MTSKRQHPSFGATLPSSLDNCDHCLIQCVHLKITYKKKLVFVLEHNIISTQPQCLAHCGQPTITEILSQGLKLFN